MVKRSKLKTRLPRRGLLGGENSGSTQIYGGDGATKRDVQVEELNSALTSASKLFQDA